MSSTATAPKHRAAHKQPRRNFWNRKYSVILLILVIAALAVWPTYRFMHRKETLVLDQQMTQVVSGVDNVYAQGTRLVKEDSGVVVSGSERQLGQYPLYAAKGKQRMVLPASYEVVFPLDDSKLARVNYFTEIFRRDNAYFAQANGKEAALGNAFLFDGENTYVFLEKTTLMWRNGQAELGPMSYVTVGYGQDMIYYDATSGDSKKINSAGEVKALLNNDVTVHLDTDTLERRGQQQLLYGDPSKLALLQ
ncbi:hypothetical protein JS530_10165 [Bifidobacterium sp. LC6]|uniref:LPS export ABC transporter periplasmic protein LptC n=1 Tax=Bifidobacterium colobi TaxID=2809026 RepID=A0ABS5UXQ7_9BIFI|nr:hypothetical protein [Bifidobacterium colobi]MBT1175855.1 hypothetical protein [Bifidobacterium colobi]